MDAILQWFQFWDRKFLSFFLFLFVGGWSYKFYMAWNLAFQYCSTAFAWHNYLENDEITAWQNLFDLTFLTVTCHFISSSNNILLKESYELLWSIIDVFIDHIPTRIIFFLVCNFHLDFHTILLIYNTQMFFKYTHSTQRVT